MHIAINVVKYVAMIATMLTLSISAWGGYTFNKQSEWPLATQTTYLPAGANAVVEGGNYLFWAQGDSITVIDKSGFTIVGTFFLKTATAIQDMLFDETTSTLYVAAGYDSRDNAGGLQIFDLTDPANVIERAIFDQSDDNPGSITITTGADNTKVTTEVPDIDARGLGFYSTGGNDTLFVADNNFGLRIFDVSTPSAPTEIPLTSQTEERISGYKQPDVNGSYDSTGGYVNVDVYAYGSSVYAVVLDYYFGIKVFNVNDTSDIDDPVAVKDLRSNYVYYYVSLINDLYVTEIGGRLTAVICGAGNYFYSEEEDSYGVSRMDINPSANTIRNYGRCTFPGQIRSVVASGNYAYVADASTGLQVIDISAVPDLDTDEVENYETVGSYDTDASYALAYDADYVYLASATDSGLTKINVTDRTTPQYDDNIQSPITADRIASSGNYSYMLDNDNGLRIFNNEDPLYVLLEGFLQDSGPATDIAVSGNYVYIAGEAGNVRVVDVSDPANPSFLSGVTITATEPKVLFINGRFLFIGAENPNALIIFDIQDPQYPLPVSTTALAGAPTDLWADDTRVYVSEGVSGVEIFSITAPASPSSPSAPTLVSTTDAQSVAVHTVDDATYALIADGSSGLIIQDVTDLTVALPAPVAVTTREGANDTTIAINASHVREYNGLAVVGLADNYMLFLDLSSPDSPTELNALDLAAPINETAIHSIDDDIYAFVANGSAGVRFLQVYDSDDYVDPPNLDTTLDTGCFIRTLESYQEEDSFTIF